MTTEELKNSLLSSKSFTEHQFLIYSALTVVSMTFFIALIGAEQVFMESKISTLCIITFSISLVSNTASAFIFSSSKDLENGRAFLKWFNESKYAIIFFISVISFILSIALLISIYSLCSSIIFVLCIIIYYVLYKNAINEHYRFEMNNIEKNFDNTINDVNNILD
ncbi:hypothetical protein [Arcobacter cloacae]|uniref:Uncharacterized protein n=1 Tax=Arcobacter cloacae TaxID=1054034 RepID=A0A6M8NRN0_9BACT|nr:hypothetical protein [Arcobacter cloacae]QKF90404.1 putative membrane protein [Arcobacter cloacae]RXI39595.1 hypothetical protein CP963_09670 [Arcobacter cloacae]